MPVLNSQETTLRRELSRVERLLAEKTVEVDFFKGALHEVEARRQNRNTSGEKVFTAHTHWEASGGTIIRGCQPQAITVDVKRRKTVCSDG